MDDKALRIKGRGRFVLAALSLLGIFVAEVLAVIVAVLLGISDKSLLGMLILEWFGAAAAMLASVLLGGYGLATISRDDISYTFRFGWWCLAVTVGLMCLDLVYYFSVGTPLAADWLVRLAQVVLICLAIGLFEEFLFRGVIFNGLLAVMGGTHKGVIRAILITSLLFGLAHIDFGAALVDASSIIQAVLKVVQTGMYSIMLCVIFLRTRSLVGVSLFHGLDDLLIIAPSVALFDEPLTTDYVVEGDGATTSIAVYLFVIVLYTPFVIKSLRELRRGQDVWRGAFMDRYLTAPQSPARDPQLHSLPTPVSVPASSATVPEQMWGQPTVPPPSAPAAGQAGSRGDAHRGPGLPPVPKGL